MIDLDAIEAKIQRGVAGPPCAPCEGCQAILDEDVPAMAREIRRLREENDGLQRGTGAEVRRYAEAARKYRAALVHIADCYDPGDAAHDMAHEAIDG